MTFGAIWKILTDVVHIAVLLGWLVLLGMWLTWREDFDDIEGALFPVVTATSIIESKPADNGLKTHLRLEFIKLRRCDPDAVIVIHFFGIAGKQTLVPNRWLGQSQTLISRDLGRNITNWWEVDVSWWMAQKDDFQIDVLHTCHGWWTTRTTMYVGTLANQQGNQRVPDFP